MHPFGGSFIPTAISPLLIVRILGFIMPATASRIPVHRHAQVGFTSADGSRSGARPNREIDDEE